MDCCLQLIILHSPFHEPVSFYGLHVYNWGTVYTAKRLSRAWEVATSNWKLIRINVTSRMFALLYNNVTWWLKKIAIAWQQLSKQVPATTDTFATKEELLEAVLSIQSVPRIYNEDTSWVTGGTQYNWATLFMGKINTGTWPSRLGGVSKIETIKYVHESNGTQIWERLRWRCPAKTVNYRPDFSSERAPHINKSATV
jgi:hypothetical protein